MFNEYYAILLYHIIIYGSMFIISFIYIYIYIYSTTLYHGRRIFHTYMLCIVHYIYILIIVGQLKMSQFIMHYQNVPHIKHCVNISGIIVYHYYYVYQIYYIYTYCVPTINSIRHMC